MDQPKGSAKGTEEGKGTGKGKLEGEGRGKGKKKTLQVRNSDFQQPAPPDKCESKILRMPGDRGVDGAHNEGKWPNPRGRGGGLAPLPR